MLIFRSRAPYDGRICDNESTITLLFGGLDKVFPIGIGLNKGGANMVFANLPLVRGPHHGQYPMMLLLEDSTLILSANSRTT